MESIPPLKSNRAQVRLVLLAVGVVVVGAAGWAGFAAFKDSEISSGVGLGLLVLAAATGAGVLFAPCSFPLLLTRLTHGGEETQQGALPSAIAMSLGTGAVFAVVAVVVAVVGEGLAVSLAFDSSGGRVFRAIVAGVLLVVGMEQIGWIRIPGFHGVAAVAQRSSGDPSRTRRAFGYGLAYPLLGFG